MAIYQCNYYGCTNTSIDSVMFEYPVNDWSRLNLWLLHSGDTAFNLRNFNNKYICITHFSPAMLRSNIFGRVILAEGAVPKHYLGKNEINCGLKMPDPTCGENKPTYERKEFPGDMYLESTKGNEQERLSIKPAKVYSKKKTYKTNANNYNVTQWGTQFNNETKSIKDEPQTTHTVIIPQDNDPYDKVKNESEADQEDTNGTLTDTKVKRTIPEKYTVSANVKKEFDEESGFSINGIIDAEEFNTTIKIEVPMTDLCIKTERPDMVDVKTEKGFLEPNKPVELNILHSEVDCKIEIVQETCPQETEGLLIRYKMQEDNKMIMDSPSREKLQLTEGMVIKEEYPTDNYIDTSMTHQQTNVAAGAVANVKNEWIECSDPKVECNDPVVECSSKSIECTSNTSELTNDVNDPNKWCMDLTDKEAPATAAPRPQQVGQHWRQFKTLWFCGACNIKFNYKFDLQQHKTDQHGAPPPDPPTRLRRKPAKRDKPPSRTNALEPRRLQVFQRKPTERHKPSSRTDELEPRRLQVYPRKPTDRDEPPSSTDALEPRRLQVYKRKPTERRKPPSSTDALESRRLQVVQQKPTEQHKSPSRTEELEPRRLQVVQQKPTERDEPPSRTDALEPVSCPACTAEFSYMCDLRAHMSDAHSRNAKRFQCDVCRERYKYNYLLAAHMKQHSGTNYHCDKCGRQCKTQRGLEKHLNSHTMERVFTCPKCEQMFTQRTNMLNHLIKHTPDEKYRCGTCEETFENSTDLKSHSSIHLTFFPCKVCGVRFGAEVELDAHMKVHTKDLECTFCLMRFQDAGDLQRHTATHRDMMEKVQDLSHACTQCGKRFLYRSMLLTHEKIHKPERPFACELCPQRFKTTSARNEHCKGHMKSYKCADCGKSFARTQTLELHRRIHTGEKPYSCHLCDKAFAQRFSLNSHLQRSHGHLKIRSTKKSRGQRKSKSESKRQQ